MEARDLMIGDWVHVEAHRGFNAQNVKVETIPDNDSDNKYGHHYGHIGTWLYGGDNDFRDVETKHLQPIPLTPEILEKNGFTGGKYKDYCGFVFYLSADGFREIGLTMSYKDNILWCEKIKPNYPNSFGDKYSIHHLDYVHELQHAMRLCGIEKEIIL